MEADVWTVYTLECTMNTLHFAVLVKHQAIMQKYIIINFVKMTQLYKGTGLQTYSPTHKHTQITALITKTK